MGETLRKDNRFVLAINTDKQAQLHVIPASKAVTSAQTSFCADWLMLGVARYFDTLQLK